MYFLKNIIYFKTSIRLTTYLDPKDHDLRDESHWGGLLVVDTCCKSLFMITINIVLNTYVRTCQHNEYAQFLKDTRKCQEHISQKLAQYVRGHSDLLENTMSVISPNKTNDTIVAMTSINVFLRQIKKIDSWIEKHRELDRQTGQQKH